MFIRTGAYVAVGLLLLCWSAVAEPAEAGSVRAEQVAFRGGGEAPLTGTLWLPAGVSPRAGVVVMDDVARPGLDAYSRLLVERGLAVLAYAPRGGGAEVPGLLALAEDGLAAARVLRERAGVGRVGLMGFGTHAWAAVGAAARSPEVGFLVLVSGGGGPLWRREQHRLRNEARRRGLTGPELVDLSELLGTLYDARLYAPEREARALRTLDFQLKRAKRKRWYALTPLARFEAQPVPRVLEGLRREWRDVLSHDAAEDLRRVRCPVLALLGEQDAVTPSQATARALAEGLRRPPGEPELATVRVFRGADHRLAPVTGGEAPAPDVLPTLEAWLRGLPQ